MMRILVASAAALVMAWPATAAQVGFTFNAGPVLFVETFPTDTEIEAYQDFVLGEDVLVSFTMLDTTPDGDAIVGRGEFEDPNGTITLTGADSGAMISMANGVNVQLDSQFEFDLRNITLASSMLHVFELFNDIDFLSDVPIITNPDDLGGSISELAALLNPQGLFTVRSLDVGSSAEVGTEDGLGPFVALEFGPVPSAAVVPLPAGVWLLLGGLGALALARRQQA